MTTCDSIELLLSGYDRDELDETERSAVDEHLAGCRACRLVLDQFAALSALTGAAAAADDQDGFRRSTDEVLAAVKAEVAAEAAMAAVEHDVMTLDEAAAYLRVGLDELERELDTLPTFDIGGRIRIRRCRLMAWVEERERLARNRRLLSLARHG